MTTRSISSEDGSPHAVQNKRRAARGHVVPQEEEVDVALEEEAEDRADAECSARRLNHLLPHNDNEAAQERAAAIRANGERDKLALKTVIKLDRGKLRRLLLAVRDLPVACARIEVALESHPRQKPQLVELGLFFEEAPVEDDLDKQ